MTGERGWQSSENFMSNGSVNPTEESDGIAHPALSMVLSSGLSRFLATLEAISQLVELTPSETAFDQNASTPLQRLVESACEAVPITKEGMRDGTDRAWSAFIHHFESQIVAFGDSDARLTTDQSASFIESAEDVCRLSEGHIEIRAFTRACMDTFVSKAKKLSPARRDAILESLLTTSVSAFRALIASIAGGYFEHVPGALGSDDAELSLNALLEMNDISEAVDQAIDRRVSEVLNKGFQGQVAWLEDKERLGLEPLSKLNNWERLCEAMERAHCLLHHGATVSTKYAKRVRSTSLETGDRITVDQRYVLTAIDDFSKLGIHVSVAAWRNLHASDDEHLIKFVREAAYKALKDQRWKVALTLCELGSELPASQLDADTFRVNVWLCQKRLFGVDHIRAAVESWDTSDLPNVFAFARNVLLDDFDPALEMATLLLESGDLTTTDFSTWPLLAELRLHPDFAEKLEKKDSLSRGPV